MAQLIPVSRLQYTDGNGAPLVGGSVAFCVPSTGGATLKAVWADEGQTIQLANPVPLDASGIAFSGGSQVSVWGSGQYEEFVRDADGNLIYSALMDVDKGIAGGVINGDVEVLGTLTVVGDVGVNGVLNAPQIRGGNANFGGTVNAANFTGNASLGSLTAATSHVTGSSQLDGAVTANGGLSGLNALFENLTVGNLTVTNSVNYPTVRGGVATTDGTGTATITFTPAFRGGSLSMTATLYNYLSTGFAIIGGVSSTGGTVIAFDSGNNPIAGEIVLWIAVGLD